MILVKITNSTEVVASKTHKLFAKITPEKIDENLVEAEVIKQMGSDLASFGLKGEISIVKGIDIDPSDNIYITGDIEDNLDGNTAQGRDIFLVKFNSSSSLADLLKTLISPLLFRPITPADTPDNTASVNFLRSSSSRLASTSPFLLILICSVILLNVFVKVLISSSF